MKNLQVQVQKTVTVDVPVDTFYKHKLFDWYIAVGEHQATEFTDDNYRTAIRPANNIIFEFILQIAASDDYKQITEDEFKRAEFLAWLKFFNHKPVMP